MIKACKEDVPVFHAAHRYRLFPAFPSLGVSVATLLCQYALSRFWRASEGTARFRANAEINFRVVEAVVPTACYRHALGKGLYN
jgi:hypothetical protein